MNRSEQIKYLAAKLKHNIEAMEAYGKIVSEKYSKGENNTVGYNVMLDRYNKARGKVQDLRYALGELNARLTPDGVLEIY
jgi:hypothetical protein